jgi:hypothetical protein
MTDTRPPVWAKFQNDFNAMSNNDVIEETRRMEEQADEAEEWLEAVAAWTDAGRPRTGADQ